MRRNLSGGFLGKTSKGKRDVWGEIVILLLNIVIAVGAWNWDNNLAAIKGTSQGKVNLQMTAEQKDGKNNIFYIIRATELAKLELLSLGPMKVLIV